MCLHFGQIETIFGPDVDVARRSLPSSGDVGAGSGSGDIGADTGDIGTRGASGIRTGIGLDMGCSDPKPRSIAPTTDKMPEKIMKFWR